MLVHEGKLLAIDCRDIENETFDNWEEITYIGPRAFCFVLSPFKYIIIPKNVTKIGEEAFKKCANLRSVLINDNCLELEKGIFEYCNDLKNVVLPKDLTYIPKGMFLECKSLKKIYLPEKIEIIDSEAFKNSGIKKIKFTENLKVIKNNAFQNCSELISLKIPDSVEILEKNAFNWCTKLSNLTLGKNISVIPESCFFYCHNLKNIYIPSNIKRIEKSAFYNCDNLETIVFENNDIEIDSLAFDCCKNFKKIRVGKKSYYIEDYKNLISMNRTEITAIIKLMLNVDIEDIKKSNIKYAASFIESIDGKMIKQIYKKNVTKHFKNIYNNYKDYLTGVKTENVRCFYKFAYYLGCFSDKTYIENNKEISVCQQANVLLKYIIDEKLISLDKFYDFFGQLEVKCENIDVLRLLMKKDRIDDRTVYSNLLYLLDKRNNVSEILNNIDKIKSMVITDKKGRIIKDATLRRKIEGYLSHERFENIDEDSIELADELGNFPTITQEHFLQALEIKKRGENAPNHILIEEIKEEIIRERIKKIKNDISLSLDESKKQIEELKKIQFTYEWLGKHDPKNFTLGLYCDCCASIASTLYGKDIMIDSIIRDDMQNLQIKDISGKIVAKATLYLNRENGYIVFNTIQVNDREDFDYYDKEKIYKAFKRAIKEFVSKYDQMYPNNPIKKVNIGMGTNDLLDIIVSECEQEEEVLQVPDCFFDANLEQNILYRKKR